MGLKDTLGRAARRALRAAGDVAVTGTYESLVSTSHDASAGAHLAIYASAHDIALILGEFSLVEIDGDRIRREDRRGWCARLDLADDWGLALAPTPGDRFHTAEAAWEVIGVASDPAEAVWILHLRRP